MATRESETDVYHSHVLEEVHSVPQGPHWDIKAEQRQQDLGHMAFIGPMAGELWGSWAETGLVDPKRTWFP